MKGGVETVEGRSLMVACEINAGWSDTNITDWDGSAGISYRAFVERKILCLAGLLCIIG